LSYGEMVVREEDPRCHFGRFAPFFATALGRSRSAGLVACLYDAVRFAKGPKSHIHLQVDIGMTPM
ncbi:MAG TPA: hypothetical protein VIN37_02270, partial [Candidatus Limnocylindria bacterium]